MESIRILMRNGKKQECEYRLTCLEMLWPQADIQGLHDKIKTREEGIKVQEHTKAELMRQSGELQRSMRSCYFV